MAEENHAPDTSTVAPHSGRFKTGFDPRRHRFTLDECRLGGIRGYKAAWASLERRFPGCDPHFLLCAIIGSRPWHTLPTICALLERDEPLSDTDALRLFGQDNPMEEHR